MSVTTSQLNNNCTTIRAFSVAIKDQLDVIDSKIRGADQKFGKNVITHELPSTFMIHGTDRCTEQKIVYASIINSLQQRGFKVHIMVDEAISVLVISWVISLPGGELESINSIIKNARISKETFNDIMTGTRSAGHKTSRSGR